MNTLYGELFHFSSSSVCMEKQPKREKKEFRPEISKKNTVQSWRVVAFDISDVSVCVSVFCSAKASNKRKYTKENIRLRLFFP